MSDDTSADMTIVGDQAPKVTEATIKKNDLLKRVVEATGKKQNDVKDVFEATIAALAAGLAAGEQMQLPPLGRLKVNKVKTVANGKVLSLRIRMTDAAEKE